MTKNGLYCVVCSIVAFYLYSGASSSQHMISKSDSKDRNVFLVAAKSKSGAVGTSCAPKSSKKSTSTTAIGNIRETFFTKMNEHNDAASTLLNQLWHSKAGWQHVNTKDGVSVERRSLPAGSFVDATDAAKGSKHACVRSSGVIKATPQSVIDLFLDNSRVSEYNEHCIQVKDIVQLPRTNDNQWTKLSWAAGPKYGPFKARDFATVVDFRKYNNGTFMIINRPAYHPDYPPTNKYVRATTLLVGNIIEPIAGALNEKHTRITQVAHVNPGGAGDTAAVAFVINKLCAVGPPNFIRKLEIAAQKSDLMNIKKKDKNFSVPSFEKDLEKFKMQWSKLKIPDFFDEKASKKRKFVVVAFINSRKNMFK